MISKTISRRKINYFIWHQGETDASIGTTEEAYQKLLAGVFKVIRKLSVYQKGLSKILVFQASKCYDNKSEAVIRGQRNFIDNNPDAYLVMNTDKLGLEFRYDGCHFNKKGINKINSSLLKAITH